MRTVTQTSCGDGPSIRYIHMLPYHTWHYATPNCDMSRNWRRDFCFSLAELLLRSHHQRCEPCKPTKLAPVTADVGESEPPTLAILRSLSRNQPHYVRIQDDKHGS